MMARPRNMEGPSMSARGAPQPRGMGLRNGLVLAALLIAALASGSSFAADNITLDDIGFQIGDTTYRLPRVEFVGPNLDRPQLRALFDANATQPLPARLAALSAKAVNVPELIAEWSSSEGRQTVSVRALSLQNVVAGRAARVSAGEVTSEGAFITFITIGSVAATDLNFALAAKVYADGSARSDKDADAIVGGLDLNAIDVRTKKGSTVHADRFSMSALRALPGSGPAGEAEAGDAQRYMSGVGTASLAGVSADVASGEAVGDRLKLSMKRASLSTEHPYNGLPTDVAVTVDDFEVALPANAETSGARDLRDMGYDVLHGSLQAAGSWNEAASEMVGDVTLRIRDAGSVGVRATIGNVTKEAFASTPAVAEAASSKATLKAFVVSVSDSGLFGRLVANEARKQNRSQDDIRSELAAQSAAAVASILSVFPDALVVARAVVNFIKRPGDLEIAVKAKSRSGISWADLFAALPVPAEIAEKLSVTAHVK
jgi:hypothetical protein